MNRLCMAVSILSLAAPAAAQVASSRPAARHADWPAELSDSADSLTAADRQILGQIADGTGGIDDLGLCLLLDHIGDMQPEDAATVTAADLRADPARFRGRPVRIQLRYVQTQAVTPARPKPYGELFETIAAAGGDGAAEPVKVISHYQPAEMIPGQWLEVTGYFYKMQSCPARSGGPDLLLPVLVAHHITPAETASRPFDVTAAVVIGVLVAGLAALAGASTFCRRLDGKATP